jgi:membrane-bound serine protease (ClpP class)
VRELLTSIDGRTVEVEGRTVVLTTKNATIVESKMDWKHSILDILSDPNIAYIFFLLGLYGLMFELYNPGSILPGVVGVISIIIAFYSLHTLPINYAGLALIIVGIILFILELKIVSHGLLAIGGVIALLLGSIMLINSESSLEFIRLSWSVIIPSVLLTALFFLFAIGAGVRAQRRKPVTGVEGIVGELGEVMTDLAPEGQVRVHGEIWKATSDGGTIPRGARIRVKQVDSLRLIVTRME